VLARNPSSYDFLAALDLPPPIRRARTAPLEPATVPERAQLLGSFDCLIIDNVATSQLRPQQLEAIQVWVGTGGLLIEVKAVGIQGGDLLHRAGGVMATNPHVVGYQAAGVVKEIGAGVEGFAVGQPVVATMGYGSHAELVSVPAGSAFVIPDGLSIEEAAGASLVLATASSDDRLDRLGEYGMDHGINYASQDVPKRVRELTEGRGVDLVVDPVGGTTLEGSIAALAYRGRISWVGRAGREERPPEVWPLMEKNASLTGVFLGAEMGHSHRVRGMIERLLQRVAAGELRVVIDRVFPLADAAEAHRYIESRRAFGRVLLAP